MTEIRKIGFDEENLDGLTFCDDDLYAYLMNRHDEMLEYDERNAE